MSSPVAHIALPPIPASFGDLDKYSETEFSHMLNDEKMLDAVFETLEIVKTMRQIRSDLRDGNAELARNNLAAEAAFNDRRAELVALEQELGQRRAVYQEKLKERDQIMQRFSPESLAQELAKNINEVDRQSEDLSRRFLDEELEWKAFSKEYLELRKLYHIRNAKREALLQK